MWDLRAACRADEPTQKPRLQPSFKEAALLLHFTSLHSDFLEFHKHKEDQREWWFNDIIVV